MQLLIRRKYSQLTDAYIWGFCDRGQLGIGFDKRLEPKPVKFLNILKKRTCNNKYKLWSKLRHRF